MTTGQHTIMAKLIVLFFGAESPASALAAAAADGASGVRFTEVDLVAGGAHEQDAGRRAKRLASPEQLLAYDGVLIACPAAGEIPTELSSLLDALERITPADRFANTVFGVAGGENTTLLRRLARLGGMIVSEPRGLSDPEARARALGARTAKVVGWVRHALGHEHADQHHHHHH